MQALGYEVVPGSTLRKPCSTKEYRKYFVPVQAMTSEKHCQERRVCQVSGFRAVNKQGSQDSEMSGPDQ